MSRRVRLVVAPLVFVGASLAICAPLAYGTLLLGGSTGVIAMCATAPGWWYPVYFCIATLPVICGCAAGAYITRRVVRGTLSKP